MADQGGSVVEPRLLPITARILGNAPPRFRAAQQHFVAKAVENDMDLVKQYCEKSEEE